GAAHDRRAHPRRVLDEPAASRRSPDRAAAAQPVARGRAPPRAPNRDRLRAERGGLPATTPRRLAIKQLGQEKNPRMVSPWVPRERVIVAGAGFEPATFEL